MRKGQMGGIFTQGTTIARKTELDGAKLKRKKKVPRILTQRNKTVEEKVLVLKTDPSKSPISLSVSRDIDPRYRRATKDPSLFQKMVEACDPKD